MPDDAASAFHAHLDVCRRCEENPFDLCSTGMALAACVLQDFTMKPAVDAAFAAGSSAAEDILKSWRSRGPAS